MTDLVRLDSQIQIEVDRLREQFTNTRDLYREVCSLLFFRFGITPTTNKLYQFVRKGSMSVPTEVLNNFWKELRDKSKVKIEHPDLPEELGNLAGEVIGKIWVKAQLEAQELLNSLRNESEAKISELQDERDTLANYRDDLLNQLESAETTLNNQSQKLQERDQLVANINAQKTLLEEQLWQSKSHQDNLNKSMENNRKEFESELIKMQESMQDLKVRCQEDLTRSLMEVEQGKTLITDLKEDLKVNREAYANLQKQSSTETNLLRSQIAELREKMAELNGVLQTTQSNNEKLNEIVLVSDRNLKESLAKIAVIEAQNKHWQLMAQQKKTKRFLPSRRR